MDITITLFLNGFVGTSDFLDNFVKMLENPILKALPFVLALVYLWFQEHAHQSWRRNMIVATSVTSLIAILVGRILALVLRFRLRPIHDPSIEIRLPQGHTQDILQGWSAMPSDHAVYFTSLCVFLVLMHRPLGLFFSVYAFVVILLPRIYFGWHWPSDILAGIFVGTLVSLAMAKPMLDLEDRFRVLARIVASPHIAYPALIFIAFQMATMFESLRVLISDLARGII